MKTAALNVKPGTTVKYHGEPCIVLEHRADGTMLAVLEQIKLIFNIRQDVDCVKLEKLIRLQNRLKSAK